MYRLAFVGLLSFVLFGILSFFPGIGFIFGCISVASITIAVVSFIAAVVKTLFFGFW